MATAQSAGGEVPRSAAVCPPGQQHREPLLREESPKPAAADARAKAKERSELAALHLAPATKEVINRNNQTRAAACLGTTSINPSVLDRGTSASTGSRNSKNQMDAKKAL